MSKTFYQCRSGRHLWEDIVDGALCCNGHTRCIAADTPELAGLALDAIQYRRYGWRLVDIDDYDPDYEPVAVEVERTVK